MTRFRVTSENEDWEAVLMLLHTAFAYMETRIDPPSSLRRWTAEHMAAVASSGFAILGEEADALTACAFAKRADDALYIGKIAVAESHRGRGLLRQIIGVADAEVRLANLLKLRLETRIELTENRAAFAALGFVKIAETAHPGFDRPTSITMERAVLPMDQR
ncbi:MAG: GNAT family N-acetyltransferase [Pseudomonadota bacterium]